MKKIILLSSVICITSVIVWGIFALPLITDASDTNKKAEQHFEKAIEHIRQLMYEEAIIELEKVIEMVPKSEIAQDAQYWIGQSYYKAGKYDDALSTFEKLTEEYPESAVTPVTKLMVGRVREAKNNEILKRKISYESGKSVIIDPKTGVKYTKTKTFVGKRDVINWPSYLNLSPNGKFLLRHNLVIPMNGEESFNLVDMVESASGHWSPDGKKVVFGLGGAIWVVPVSPETGRATGPAKKLLDGNYQFSARKTWWSPDGEKLVFSRDDDEVSGDIWTISVKDGALTQITDDPLAEYGPAWSPDGKTIAYVKETIAHGKYYSIWLVPAEGGMPRRIIDDGSHISWSPDGKWLFYENGRKFFRLADGRVFDFYRDPPDEVGSFFSWSSDGKKMLFYRQSYDYTCILKVVSSSGGPSFQLGRDLGLWPYVHFWSPDSKMIITKGGAPIDMKYFDDLAFWIIPLAGGDALPLDIDVSVIGKPHPRSLSPDCKRLLFFVEQGEGKEDLYVAPVSLEDARTTGPAVMVFKGRIGRGSGSFSPDGSKIAMSHEGDIWIASVKGGKPVQITKTPEIEKGPKWSPDNEMIVYIVNKGGGEQILHVISVSGGEATKILDTPVGTDGYAWSPDGKEIAVISKGVLSAIPIAGGKARQILDLKHQGFVRDEAWGLNWLPDGKYLAFISQKVEGGLTQIFKVPAKGGKVTQLSADYDEWKDWLYPSPDGKWISYDSEGTVKTRPEGAIWEMDLEEILEKLLE